MNLGLLFAACFLHPHVPSNALVVEVVDLFMSKLSDISDAICSLFMSCLINLLVSSEISLPYFHFCKPWEK